MNTRRYDRISLILKVFLVRIEISIDRIMYGDENFIPSRYAFCLVFLPKIIDDIRIEIIGISSLITFVGMFRK